MELLESLEMLFLAGKETEAKDFLSTSKIAKKQREILENWEEQGYLEQSEKGKKKFYRLGELGIRILQKEPGRWLYLQKERAKLEKQEMKTFLEIVREKSGKALNSAERSKNIRWIEECLQSGKIEQAGTNKYLLTAKGKSFLLALRPPEEILTQLQKTIDIVCAEVQQAQTAHRDLIEEFSLEQPDFQDFLQRHFGYAQKHLQYAASELDIVKRRAEIIHIASREKREIIEDVEKIKTGFLQTLEETREKIAIRQDEWFNTHALRLQEEKQRREEQIQQLLEKQETLINLHQSVRLFLTEWELQMPDHAFKESSNLPKEPDSEPLKMSEVDDQALPAKNLPPQPEQAASTWADDPEQDEAFVVDTPKAPALDLTATNEGQMELRETPDLPPSPVQEYEYEEEVLYETEAESPVDVQQVVYQTAREMLQQTVSVSLPELFEKVKMRIGVSETEFEHVIRLLHPVLQLETADPEMEGGLWILGNYCYYVVGV